MAGGGVGEAMLIGAAVGAGTGAVGSAIQKKDIGEGALLGALGGAATGGIGSGIGGAAGSALESAATPALESGLANAGTTAATQELGGAALNQFGTSAADQLAQQGAQQTLQQTAQTGASDLAQVVGSRQGDIVNGIQTAANPTSSGTGIATGLSTAQQIGAGGAGGISGLMAANNQPAPYQAPGTETYNGPLSKFKMAGPSLSQYNYDPNSFKPSIAPGYADGGIATLGQTVGQGNTMYPQSQIPDRMQFSEPTQMPTSAEVVRSDYDTKINPYTGESLMARGGIADLGSYSDGGRLLRGPGDGMSDNIPASIAGKQPARLADGEFVVPADVVSHLGNGSTDAGAKTLYGMMDKVRKARTGSKKQGKQINADKYIPGMASGGIACLADGGETEAPKETVQTVEVNQPTGYNPSVYTPTTYNYSPYTVANRPSGDAPQYYGNIYRGESPDYSTPGYTLTGGNLGRWSNVAGEAARAAQPASMNQQVTQSYLQQLGRAPDQNSFNQYMQSGMSAPQVQQAIRYSPESYNIGNISAQDYINGLYQTQLGREADQGGYDYWLNRLNKGATADQIMQGFTGSQEYQSLHPNAGSGIQYTPQKPQTVRAKTVQDLIDESLAKYKADNPVSNNDSSANWYMTSGG